VFLFSHRSHLDGMAMFSIAHHEGLPPSHIVGGDNMAVFPIGAIARRSGVVFIRRSFRDDPVYKATIRQYVDYLLEKRFSLSWAIEGTRSRSGKLMPPKLGMLAYVVDSWRRGRVDDVVLVPVSIAYDQIVELADYEKEQHGGKKRAESFSWLVGFVSGIRAPHGRMYVEFGEPLSLGEFFDERGEPGGSEPEAPGLDLQKLAFEVSVRINRATRVTATSIVSLVLLESEHRAMSLGEISFEAAALEAFARERGLPAADALDLATPEGVRAALASLVSAGVASVHEEGHEPVYAIVPGKHAAAAYYRNTVLHFFLSAAVAELALLSFAKSDERVPRAALFFEVARIRDVLKFEFFFSERSVFEREVADEIARTDPEWEAHLDRAGIRAWFDRRRPLVAAGTLRPFLEGYRIVAEELARGGDEETTREKLLAASFGLGTQRVLQRRIACPDAATKETLRNGIELASHRGLLEAGRAAERRELFEEIRELNRRADAIWRIAAARHADPFA
jgi:glycerol-3-phosphate O-acyltransferase